MLGASSSCCSSLSSIVSSWLVSMATRSFSYCSSAYRMRVDAFPIFLWMRRVRRAVSFLSTGMLKLVRSSASVVDESLSFSLDDMNKCVMDLLPSFICMLHWGWNSCCCCCLLFFIHGDDDDGDDVVRGHDCVNANDDDWCMMCCAFLAIAADGELFQANADAVRLFLFRTALPTPRVANDAMRMSAFFAIFIVA